MTSDERGWPGFELAAGPIRQLLRRRPCSVSKRQVVQLTGITDADVRGRKLNDTLVAELVAEANLVIAHNAGFDRRFVERRLPMFVDKAWACSLEQVP